MTRINALLLLAVVATAIYLVRVQYESRSLFSELDKAHSQARRLAMDVERLEVEKRAQASPGRVERLAREKLDMRQPTPGITTYMSYPADGIPAAAKTATP
jgi:cell division protein FtsL